MARATRSSAAQEKEKPVEAPTPARKGASKKRKRASIAEQPEQPATKLARTDDVVKEEDVHDGDDIQAEETKPELPSSGDVPLQAEDAEKILDVLEMIDTQGLLDRIFPLPTEHHPDSDSTAGPSTNTQSYSFRILLKSPSKFPPRVLRLAIDHLFPISSHPRARPSATAAEQLRFCHLALSLINQASAHNAPVPLDVASILSSFEAADEPSEEKQRIGSPLSKRKYALLQRLPTGDWWTSANSSYPPLSLDEKGVKGLGTGHAELAAVFPSIPISASSYQPKLGDYIKKRPPVHNIVQQPRKLSCGKFLDYGPFASFAPTFEQEGSEVGRVKLGEVIWYKEIDRRGKAYAPARRKLPPGRDDDIVMADDEVVEIEPPSPKKQEKMPEQEIDTSLEGLFSPEQISLLKEKLNSEELEQGVDELLARNARALARLEQLQMERLLAPGSKQVEEGSEEWDLAQGIFDSLALLTSLRPREPGSDDAPLVPTTSALRKLHRTLPLDSSGGWYGTLPENRATAIRDDTTLHVRAGSAIPTAAPAAAATTVPATPTAAKPSTTPYNYAYPNYATASYQNRYNAYTPGTTNYYPNYANSTAAATPTTTTPTTHYPTQYAPGTQPYNSYQGWYNYQQQTAQNGAATPAASTPVTTGATSYGFFPNTPTPQAPQRAVANTVLAKPAAYQGGWSNGSSAPTAYVAPLPAHLRSSAAGAAQPAATPAAASYTGYYAGYQAAQAQSTTR